MAIVRPNQIYSTIATDAAEGTTTLEVSEFNNVTVAEAHPTTGNFGIVFRGIVESTYAGIQALPTAERPTRWNIIKSSETAVPNVSNSRRVTYTVTFDTIAPAEQFEVMAE